MAKLQEPMLAASTVRFSGDRRLIAEPKGDGWRMMAVVGKDGLTFYTRGLHTEPFTSNLRFLADEIGPLPVGLVLDGELLRDNLRLVPQWRRESLSEEDIEAMSEDTVWMLFDLYDPKKPSEPLHKRKARLRKLVKESDHVMISPQVQVKDETHLQQIYKRAIKNGWEGLVVKDLDSVYVPGGRPDHWMKMKARDTVDGRVVGFKEGTGMYKGTLGSLLVKSGGKTLKVSGFSDKVKDQIWKNKKKYLGKWVSFNVLKGSWREPKFVGWREDL